MSRNGVPARRAPGAVRSYVFFLGLLSLTAFALTTSAQTKKQNPLTPFNHTEVVQFFSTVQTQASSWEETISSIDPSAFHMNGQAKALIEKQKGDLLYHVTDIGKLRPGREPKNPDLDLAVEFWLFDDLCEIKEGVSNLSETLADDPNGNLAAGRLVEIYKEAAMAKSTLFKEIENRITNISSRESIDLTKP